VSNLLDAPVTGPGSAPGTLRQAIYDANNTPGDDIIKFDTGLAGTVSLTVVGDTAVGNSALLITSTVTILGSPAGVTIARSNTAAEMRLFRVAVGGSLTLDTVSLTGGRARGVHGTSPGEDGGNGLGGAIYSQGVVHISDSTLYENQAIGGNAGAGGRGGGGFGGAVHSDHATLTVVNSTFSGSSVLSGTGASFEGSRGGAIAAENGSTSIFNSTLTESTASTGRGLFVHALNGTATVVIRSSIIGQSDISAQRREFLTAPDTNGEIIVTGSGNLIRSQGDFQYITVSTDDPLLEPLANNGGPVMTHALTANSPALNLGNNTQGLTFDARGAGFARVVGGVVDIGAYELQNAAGSALSGDYNGNQAVDGADYVVWRKTFGSSVPKFSGADGDGSTFVDSGDYQVWRQNYGASGAGTSASAALAAAYTEPQNPNVAVQDTRETGTLDTALALASRSGRMIARSESRMDLAIDPFAYDDALLVLLHRSAAVESGESLDGNCPDRKIVTANESSGGAFDMIWSNWPPELGSL